MILNEWEGKVAWSLEVYGGAVCLECTHEWQQLNRSYHRDKQTEGTHVGARPRRRTNTFQHFDR